MIDTGDLTALLQRWKQGDATARDALLQRVYPHLHNLAIRRLSREHAALTLQATDLVHEAYLQLSRQERAQWQNREQFFAIAATVLRRIVIDHIKRRRRIKRGGDAQTVSLEDVQDVAARSSSTLIDVLELDRALDELEAVDPRGAEVVQLRYFAGLTVREVAEATSRSVASVNRDWSFCRAWLGKRLAEGAPPQ